MFELKVTLLGNVADVGDSFTYSYDFGDGWEHKVTVEHVIPVAPGMTVPTCADGRRACPPEDCGGPWGYGELLAILADPSHPEHEERVMWAGEWGGGMLDSDAFDTSEFNDNLDLLRIVRTYPRGFVVEYPQGYAPLRHPTDRGVLT